MSSSNGMTKVRAEEIALLIAQYRARRKKMVIDPTDRTCFARVARKLGISDDEAKLFLTNVIMPCCLAAVTSDKSGGVQGVADVAIKQICGRVALRILQTDVVTLDPDSTKNLFGKIASETGVPEYEIKGLYIKFILPTIIGKIMGWPTCQITSD